MKATTAHLRLREAGYRTDDLEGRVSLDLARRAATTPEGGVRRLTLWEVLRLIPKIVAVLTSDEFRAVLPRVAELIEQVAERLRVIFNEGVNDQGVSQEGSDAGA